MSHEILIVEDDPTVRELVDVVLSRAGYPVLLARDGIVALDMLRYVRPALVLLDINMPGMSGLEVLKTVRHTLRLSTPVLMMTADQSVDTVRDVKALGANGYLLKPFTHEDLLARVKKALTLPVAEKAKRPTGAQGG